MFSDGRLVFHLPPRSAGQVSSTQKGPIEHPRCHWGGFADFGQIGIHTCSYPLIVVGGGGKPTGDKPLTGGPDRRGLPTLNAAAGAWGDGRLTGSATATMSTVAFAVALFGWALVHLASAPIHKDDQRPAASRLRRWVNAAYSRSQKARD